MKKTLIGLSILSAPVLAASPVYAHAFGQRYDLPIPLSYFMAGAAATVALSFVIIGLFLKGGGAEYQYPRFNLLALPGTSPDIPNQVRRCARPVGPAASAGNRDILRRH